MATLKYRKGQSKRTLGGKRKNMKSMKLKKSKKVLRKTLKSKKSKKSKISKKIRRKTLKKGGFNIPIFDSSPSEKFFHKREKVHNLLIKLVGKHWKMVNQPHPENMIDMNIQIEWWREKDTPIPEGRVDQYGQIYHFDKLYNGIKTDMFNTTLDPNTVILEQNHALIKSKWTKGQLQPLWDNMHSD
tara:strand:+ start:474 stop:1031 length:558 start_codon:yes stop_codon:yes gene_type:complete